MSYHDQYAQLNPLSQIPLTKSPFIQFPQAVTLPYNYVQLPVASSLSPIPDIPPPSTSLREEVHRRTIKIEQAKERWEKWEADMKERRIKAARKIAPGFLDTGVTMLTPTVIERDVVRSGESHQTSTGKELEEKKDDYLDQFSSLRF